MAAASSPPSAEVAAGDGDRVIAISNQVQNLNDATVEEKFNENKAALGNGWRYWTVIAALSVTALLPAMEGTVVSTALPSIIQDLHGGELYVWVVNSYFLTR